MTTPVRKPLPAASAPTPFRSEDIHPSIRGEKVPPMRSRLSSYEFRSYRRRDGTIILHLRSILLVETRVTLGDSYLSGMAAAVRLADGRNIVVDTMSIGGELALPFDGHTMAIDVRLPVPTGMTVLRPGFANLDLRVGWCIAGAPFEARVRQKSVVGRVREWPRARWKAA